MHKSSRQLSRPNLPFSTILPTHPQPCTLTQRLCSLPKHQTRPTETHTHFCITLSPATTATLGLKPNLSSVKHCLPDLNSHYLVPSSLQALSLNPSLFMPINRKNDRVPILGYVFLKTIPRGRAY